ncbi:MAG: hypothetical protein WCD04_18345 [Terriglobia bacterium]|jgi:hypothetical protein
MKRTIFVLLALLVVFVAVFSVLVLRPVPKAKAATTTIACTNRTLLGTYGLVASGFYLHDDTSVPGDVSGLVTFNGRGTFTGSTLYIVANGSGLPDNPYYIPTGSATATYTVSPDCSVTLQIAGQFGGSVTVYAYGTIVDLVADEIVGNVLSSNPNVTGTFHATKVPLIAAPPLPPA